jgi:hypothetical protein
MELEQKNIIFGRFDELLSLKSNKTVVEELHDHIKKTYASKEI